MADTPDLALLLQRRELLAYEQRQARSRYAYGVDLRRAAWLHNSRIGDPLLRGVDRGWTATTQVLAERLSPRRRSPPPEILEELARLIRLLRAPLPAVRLLRPGLQERWPIATPLGTTRGGVHWLIVDTERLMDATPTERAFVLGWALGHLQCDHGPLFAAHLMAHQTKRSLGALGLILRPWARVGTFSADRAAMLAVRTLDHALDGLPLTAADDVSWMPKVPDLQSRRRALEDFARSSVLARLRLLTEVGHPDWSLGPPKPAANGAMAERLGNVLGVAARLGSNAAWVLGGGLLPADPVATEEDAGDGKPRKAKPELTTGPGDPIERDPKLRARLELALKDTWSVARCDQTLTRKLGLL